MKFSRIIALACIGSIATVSATKHHTSHGSSKGQKVLHAVSQGAHVLSEVMSFFRRSELDGAHADIIFSRDLQDEDLLVLRDLIYDLLEERDSQDPTMVAQTEHQDTGAREDEAGPVHAPVTPHAHRHTGRRRALSERNFYADSSSS
jgi:hypothetical protein